MPPFTPKSVQRIPLCYDKTIEKSKEEESNMRHYYFRLFFGIIWLLAALVSFLSANIWFSILYIVLGACFLLSAYHLGKDREDK